MSQKFNVETIPGEVILRPEGQPGEISISMTYAQLEEKYGSDEALKIYEILYREKFCANQTVLRSEKNNFFVSHIG